MKIFLLLVLLATTLLAKTQIRVQGISSEEAKIVLERLSGRLTYVRDRPAGPSRADDAAFLMKRYFLLEGYREVEVDWELPSDGSILLKVSRGARFLLGKYDIQNITGDSPEVHPEYFLQPFKARKRLQQDAYPYLRDDYTAGVVNLKNYLRSQGYWDADVIASEPQFDRVQGVVNVSMAERPGVLYKLGRPVLNVTGEAVSEELLSELKRVEGLPASTENIGKMRKTVDDEFRSKGYPYLTLEMGQVDKGGVTTLNFDVNTGKRYRVGDLSVTGNKHTDERHIRRRYKDLKGLEFDRDDLDERTTKLLSTGAFDAILVDEIPQEDGTLDLLLRVDEAKRYGVKFYGGVGSLEGVIIGAGYFNRNLWGQLNALEAGLEYSGVGILGDVSLTDPFFLERDLAWENRAFILTRSFDGYNKISAGVETALEWQINDYYDMRLGFGISYVDLSATDGLPTEALGVESYVTNTLEFTQRYDRRNDKALPTRGYIAEWNTRLGFAYGDDSISFFANELRYTWYREISEDHRFAIGGRVGSIKPLGDDEKLPIDLRYFLGGPNSVRSFPDRELGPKIEGNPVGGLSYFVANAEYIRNITGPLRAVVFFDMGRLSSGFDLEFEEIKYAVGLGFQLDLPIGPVRFEYGHALNPESGEPTGAFHFAIGTAF